MSITLEESEEAVEKAATAYWNDVDLYKIKQQEERKYHTTIVSFTNARKELENQSKVCDKSYAVWIESLRVNRELGG